MAILWWRAAFWTVRAAPRYYWTGLGTRWSLRGRMGPGVAAVQIAPEIECQMKMGERRGRSPVWCALHEVIDGPWGVRSKVKKDEDSKQEREKKDDGINMATHSESESSSTLSLALWSKLAAESSWRRFLDLRLPSSTGGTVIGSVTPRLCWIGEARCWIGGSELLEGILLKEGELKAWAKDGRDWGDFVVMLLLSLAALDDDICGGQGNDPN